MSAPTSPGEPSTCPSNDANNSSSSSSNITRAPSVLRWIQPQSRQRRADGFVRIMDDERNEPRVITSDNSEVAKTHSPSYASIDAERDQSPPESGKIICDWTQAEERKLQLKYDCLILPLLTLCFFCMQMDRGNIGNALTVGFFEEVNLTQHNYNVGQQLLYLGIVVLEIPSNMILYRVGPRWWLGGQIVAWGFVEIFQCFITNVGGFYTTRLLLGLCEAGFIPAGLYTLSMWYKRAETSKRFAIFYFGNLVSQGATSLLAFGIFHMNGIAGLHDWQWMFILEGIFTIVCGIILILLLPKDPNHAWPVSGLDYFTPRERDIMWKRIVLDDPSKEKKTHSVTWEEFKTVLTTWRVYPHVLVSMCGIGPVTTMLSYAPLLVKNFGYDPLKSNALVSIGGWLQIPISLLLGILADTTRRRGIALFAGLIGVWGFVIGDLIVRNYSDATTRFAILILTLGFCSTWQPINGSWLSINAATPAERSITLAMFVMAGNIGGIFGSQLFQESDNPAYTVGWSAILGLYSVALVACVVANVYYRWENRRNPHPEGEEVVDGKRKQFWL